jgi:hypothetical protein
MRWPHELALHGGDAFSLTAKLAPVSVRYAEFGGESGKRLSATTGAVASYSGDQ